MMLFRKEIEPRCGYCVHGTPVGNEQIACLKKGIVSEGFQCRGFRYDPLQRVPPEPAYLDFSKLKEEDFSL